MFYYVGIWMNKKKILIVKDDEFLISIYQMKLDSLGA